MLLALTACGRNAPVISQQEVQVTPELLREIGLPIYPGAKPASNAPALRQLLQTPYGGSEVLLVFMETADDFDRVVAFYAGQLPATSRKFLFHMGGGGSAAFEFWAKDGQRQVTLTAIRGVTLIQLQNTKLVLPSPSPSPSPAASGSGKTR